MLFHFCCGTHYFRLLLNHNKIEMICSADLNYSCNYIKLEVRVRGLFENKNALSAYLKI